MSRGEHNEPFGFDVVTAYLERKGCTFLRQSGSHVHYRTPNGALAGSGIIGHGDVTTSLMRKNAAALGMSYSELRADMGYPVTRSGKARHKPQRDQQVRSVTKKQCVERIDAVLADLREARDGIAAGRRDQSAYDRMFEAIADMDNPVRRAVAVVRPGMGGKS